MGIIGYYRVKAEDHIFKIAVKYYYHYWLWKVIYACNRELIDDPFNLVPGTNLAIYELSSGDEEHTVSEGDTYQSISESYYGTNAFFVNVMKANDNQLLAEGDTITVPALVKARELKLAEEIRNALA